MSATVPSPRVGRPRADRRRRERPPQQEILFHAARLFAKQGVAATTTREIAAAAGLRQPSLFHWFASKEAMLEALLESSLAPSLAFAERVLADGGRAAVQLHRILRFDATQLCASPYDLTAVVLSPESWTRRFARLWKGRDRLIEIVRTRIAAGVRERDFADVDPALAARLVFGMDEGVLTWFENGKRWTPDRVGTQLADLALRGLVREPRRLAAIRAASLRADRGAPSVAPAPGERRQRPK